MVIYDNTRKYNIASKLLCSLGFQRLYDVILNYGFQPFHGGNTGSNPVGPYERVRTPEGSYGHIRIIN